MATSAGRVRIALVVSSQRDLDIDGARLDGVSRQDEEQQGSHHLQSTYAPLLGRVLQDRLHPRCMGDVQRKPIYRELVRIGPCRSFASNFLRAGNRAVSLSSGSQTVAFWERVLTTHESKISGTDLPMIPESLAATCSKVRSASEADEATEKQTNSKKRPESAMRSRGSDECLSQNGKPTEAAISRVCVKTVVHLAL